MMTREDAEWIVRQIISVVEHSRDREDGIEFATNIFLGTILSEVERSKIDA
jgi:hypothetical protein